MVLIKENGAEVTVKRKILILNFIALYCTCFIDVLYSCQKFTVHGSTPYAPFKLFCPQQQLELSRYENPRFIC